MQKFDFLANLLRKPMRPYALVYLIAFAFSGLQCIPTPKERNIPTHDDVYEVRDSIRKELLLRLGHATQTISMRAEMMRRRAYSEEDSKARQLRRDQQLLKKYQTRVEARMELLQQDSVLGEWYEQLDDMELLLKDASYIIKQPL